MMSERPRHLEVQEHIIDMREYDVPYYLRVAIDKGAPPAFAMPMPNSICLR